MPKTPNKLIEQGKYSKTQDLSIDPRFLRQHDDPFEYMDLLETDRAILEALRRNHNASRSDLVKICSLPRTTIYDTLVRLELLKLVEHFSEKRSIRGRPKTLYRLR